MTLDRIKLYQRIKTVLAQMLALVLMLCVLSALAAQYASAATGHACTMACCVAMSEHDAASCPGQDHDASKLVEPLRDSDDPLCRPAVASNGVDKIARSTTETITVVAQPDADATDAEKAVAVARSSVHFVALKISESCGSECATCGASTSQTRNDRHAVVQTVAFPRGSFEIRITTYGLFAPIILRRSQGRITVPRGPPMTPQV